MNHFNLFGNKIELEKTQEGTVGRMKLVGVDKVFDKLRVGNIGVSLHYIPIYLHPYYEKLGYRKGLCPKAEKYFKETMTLPLFPKMSNSEIKKVITAVKNAVGNL